MYLTPESKRQVIVFANAKGIELTATEVEDLMEFIEEMLAYHDGVSLPLSDYYHMWRESYV